MTDEEKAVMEEWTKTKEEADAEMYANKKHCVKCINGAYCVEDAIEDRCGEYKRSYEDYLAGLAEGRKNCMTVQNAMETIKRYCKEITDENKNCSKCIFCSKGFNGCKLQRAPCEWE